MVHDAVYACDIADPKFLANAKGIAHGGGDLVAGISEFTDGPAEMSQVVMKSKGIS